jgi:hypothetical protein
MADNGGLPENPEPVLKPGHGALTQNYEGRVVMGNWTDSKSENAQYDIVGSQTKREICKPDYEGAIKAARDVQARCSKLLEGLTDYLDADKLKVSRVQLQELYGIIHFQHREYFKTIKQIIEAQERDK